MSGCGPTSWSRINPWGDRQRRRVGILGGSFNPAHDGHLFISLSALRRLGLHEIWWLVSPQNPLKTTAEMAPQAERIARARQVARHPQVLVSGLESQLGTRYTADTLAVLRRRFPLRRFVWVMGADNLQQISRWDRWQRIFRVVPVAVFDRAPYSYQALASKAARRFGRGRLTAKRARGLGDCTPPAWVFLHLRRHPASATAIRRRLTRAWHQS